MAEVNLGEKYFSRLATKCGKDPGTTEVMASLIGAAVSREGEGKAAGFHAVRDMHLLIQACTAGDTKLFQ